MDLGEWFPGRHVARHEPICIRSLGYPKNGGMAMSRLPLHHSRDFRRYFVAEAIPERNNWPR